MSNESADRIVHAISGGLGGAAALIVTYPLVAISCRQQTETKSKDGKAKGKKKSTSLLIKTMIQEEGIGSFYSGMESAIYGMTLTNFVYYYFYESAGRIAVKNRNLKKLSDFSFTGLKNVALTNLSPLESIVTGAVAGSVTALATNPFWVVNTRTTVTKSNKSFLANLVELYKQEGVASLFKGVIPALVLVINPIIQYTVFEQLKNLILRTRKGGFKPVHAFLIGALSKLIATGVTYPYITVKSRMHLQSKGGASISMSQLLVKILKEEGLAGLYNGIYVKLSQSIFTAAFLFYFKEALVGLTVKVIALLRLKKRAV